MLLFKFGELGLEAVALGGGLLGVGAELLDPAVVGCVGIVSGAAVGALSRRALVVWFEGLSRGGGAACVVRVITRGPRRRRGGGR